LKKNKTIRALTVLAASLFSLDALTAGYFLVKHFKEKNSTVQTEENKTATETQPPTEETTETTTEIPTTTEPPDEIELAVNSMTLHEKVCQMFIVRPEELTEGLDITIASENTKNYLAEYPVGGIIYFSKNLESQTQISAVINQTKQYAQETGCTPLFYSVDEEGGQVARCSESVGTTAFDSMYYYRGYGEETAFANARIIAGDIASLGFNLDFAPVADTWSNQYNTVIGTRAYSDDFSETAQLVASAVKGFREGGVFCTLKHFPGHGDTAEDSHNGTAVSYRTAEELRANEYQAFKSGIMSGADMVMVGHITVPELDTLPASLSERIIQGELRDYLGYNGVIITDSLGMGAVANIYSSDELAVMAVQAGNDILLTPDNYISAVSGIENAVRNGRISEERINESVYRILELKSQKMDIVKHGTSYEQ